MIGVGILALLVVAVESSAQQAGAPDKTEQIQKALPATATVIDVASKRVLATLPTGAGAHEVAVSHDGRWAVVSNYGVRGAPGNSLTVIDVTRASVARTIELGEFRRPHGSAFLPGDSIFVVTSTPRARHALLSVAT